MIQDFATTTSSVLCPGMPVETTRSYIIGPSSILEVTNDEAVAGIPKYRKIVGSLTCEHRDCIVDRVSFLPPRPRFRLRRPILRALTYQGYPYVHFEIKGYDRNSQWP